MLSKKGAEVGRLIPKGSVLVTCIAGTKSCIGNAAIADRDVAFNQQINAIIPNEDINPLFLYHLLTLCKPYIQNSSTDSMKGMVSKGAFELLTFINPPAKLQKRFGEIAIKAENLRVNQEKSKKEIQILSDSLMQKAFTGKLVA
jgi:type I restriction enzyme S subunit